jgi:antitoxin component HigA of HigAB toxin-antitoxin module
MSSTTSGSLEKAGGRVRRTDWTAVGHAWSVLEAELGGFDLSFSPENAERIERLVQQLLAATPADGGSTPLLRLLDSLSGWLASYENSAGPEIPSVPPVELLRHLMEANQLRQADLAPILGGQPTVSAILRGLRQINARQAVALGHRFKLSPAAFLVGASTVSATSDSGQAQIEMTSDMSGEPKLLPGWSSTTASTPTGGAG